MFCLTTTPFLLAYHDADITEAQSAWGDFVETVAAPVAPAAGCWPRRGIQHIGIVSNRLNEQRRALLQRLDRRRLWRPALTCASTPSDRATTLRRSSRQWHRCNIWASMKFTAGRPSATPSCATKLMPGLPGTGAHPAAADGSTSLRAGSVRRLWQPADHRAAGHGLLPQSPDAAGVSSPTSHYRGRVVRLAGMGTRIRTAARCRSRSLADFGLAEAALLPDQPAVAEVVAHIC